MATVNNGPTKREIIDFIHRKRSEANDVFQKQINELSLSYNERREIRNKLTKYAVEQFGLLEEEVSICVDDCTTSKRNRKQYDQLTANIERNRKIAQDLIDDVTLTGINQELLERIRKAFA